MNMQAVEYKVLASNQSVTDGGHTGGWVDLQGLINPGKRNMKFIWVVSNGTTAGAVDGSIQTAQDTGGTGLATLTSFTQLGTNGNEEKHAVPAGGHRYVRFIGSTASGKDMKVTCIALGEAYVRP